MIDHRMWMASVALFLVSLAHPAVGGELPWIVVAPNKTRFAEQSSGKPFIPWGFNYDHDRDGRLLEDYWQTDWSLVEAHFAQMKTLGANVVRVHLQIGKFMDAIDRPNQASLDRLTKLVQLAEKEGLYLDLTGLGCYHKQDVPAWYDQLSEQERWKAQANFWRAIAGRCATSPAIFCYDLMNEPVVPGGLRNDGDWLGPPFAGKHFVQFITLNQDQRPRPEIARQWIKHLVTAIREHDKRHLITVGLVDWSLDRPGLTSGFVPTEVTGDLDFIAVHLYPKRDKIEEALKTLAGFSIGKPVIIEETFPLSCSTQELESFINASKTHATGWIGFYWGMTPDELRAGKTIADAITLDWLNLFQKLAERMKKLPAN